MRYSIVGMGVSLDPVSGGRLDPNARPPARGQRGDEIGGATSFCAGLVAAPLAAEHLQG